jgi:hypothetical protein
MGESILTFVFGRYKEDMTRTLESLPPNARVVIWTKDVEIPNIGREPSTYFRYIIANYDTLEGTYVFAQANPYPHVPDWDMWVKTLPNDKAFDWVGVPWICRGDGRNQDSNIPVDECYKYIYDGNVVQDTYHFHEGCHFMVTAERIKQHPKLLKFNDEYHPKAPWAFERLWADVFHENA